MGFMTREASIEVPYKKSDCFSAISSILDNMNTVKIRTANIDTGIIQASIKSTFTSLSFGDDVMIQIITGAGGSTKITISSSAKAPTALAGVQQERNIAKIMDAFANEIKQYQEIPPCEKNSSLGAADEIMKYKKLLDAGAITQEEYEAKKKQLLNL